MKALYNDGSVAELPQDEVTHVIRHSAAHIMAQAIKRLYPEADFAYGPATDNGFYYDVDLPEGVKISEDDFPAIEAEMKKIVKENLKFTVFEKPRAEAIALMEERGEKYKVEHIGDLDDDARITFYQQGDYIDMCVGPHICYTKALKAFKLTGVSGAYWKGDKDNKMLTRINGVAFATKDTVDIADYFGVETGNKVNKIEKAGCHVHKSHHVNAPIIEEFPVTLECECTSYDDNTGILVGKIVAQQADESVLTDGKIDYDKLQPVIFDIATMTYRLIGPVVGQAFHDGLKLKG